MLGTGLLVMGAFGRSSSDQEKRRRTLHSLTEAREALIGYAVRYGRLPRPAISALDGREAPTPCQSETECTGFLPWVTLGISGADSWGKLLHYSVTPAFTTVNLNASTSIPTKQVLGRDANGLLSYKVGGAACTLAMPCTPAVIFSNGKNNLGISRLGIAMANASLSNSDELDNNNTTHLFYAYAAQSDPAKPGGEFDDLLTWVPLPTLYQQMSRAGALRTINLYSGMPGN
ncbi:hypothetical protein SAMN05216320_112126 [Duganella sp. OV458]|nr:hypothetical protein SAMN05216320_112126 [Duganella sp. OV458]SDK52064.1 hypothetical protein SAMN05428973_112126 [Duganella sp. OV510]